MNWLNNLFYISWTKAESQHVTEIMRKWSLTMYNITQHWSNKRRKYFGKLVLPGICSDWIFSLHLAVVLVPCKQLFNGFSLYCFTHILFLPNVLTALSAGSHPSLPSTCRHSSRGSLRDRNRWWLCANHAIMCRLYPTSFTIKQNPQFNMDFRYFSIDWLLIIK